MGTEGGVVAVPESSERGVSVSRRVPSRLGRMGGVVRAGGAQPPDRTGVGKPPGRPRRPAREARGVGGGAGRELVSRVALSRLLWNFIFAALPPSGGAREP